MSFRTIILGGVLVLSMNSICTEETNTSSDDEDIYLPTDTYKHNPAHMFHFKKFLWQVIAAYTIHSASQTGSHWLRSRASLGRTDFVSSFAVLIASRETFKAQAYILDDVYGKEPSTLAHVIGFVLTILAPPNKVFSETPAFITILLKHITHEFGGRRLGYRQ